jgi:hypothetical protein
MRSALKLFCFLFFAVPLVVATALLLAVDRHPIVNRTAEITPESIGRAKRIFDANDPRRLRTGARRTISLSQRDLDSAANYLAKQYANGSARIALEGNDARLIASLPVPKTPVRLYINIDAVFTEAAPLPKFQRLQLGRLPVPEWIADWVLKRAVIQAIGNEAFHAGTAAIKQVDLSDGRLSVTYEWHVQLEENLRVAFLSPDERERIEIYQRHLSEITRSDSLGNISLTELLSALFKLAQKRSDTHDPLAENRAAILVLTFYINQKELETLLPAAKQWPRPLARTVTIKGRHDFPQHFMTSAALAAKAGGPFSDAVGLYKEVIDSRRGSGFSFGDIAADRAGTRFGEKAVASADSARALQRRVAAGMNESDIIPMTEDLPESMNEAEFRRRFGDVDGAAYRQMMNEIEQRLAALALYR